MREFQFKGYYLYSGRIGDLTGKLNLHSKNNFKGIITAHMSGSPEQLILGEIAVAKEKTHLAFFKFPPNEGLANLLYVLSKEGNKTFEGKYTGRWSALPYKIHIHNEKIGLILASVDPKVMGIGDYAELTLSTK
ncbi:MAG: hypothetical protein WC413_03840 [Candidatus Nanoarchaeia archaeon]